jgi:hypothetical protein
MEKANRLVVRFDEVRSFVSASYRPDLRARRVASLAGATLGATTAASLAMIGQLAQARGLMTKHAAKQVDRLFSNSDIDVWDRFARWVPLHIAGRQNILAAVDWTDSDREDQARSALGLVTCHRADQRPRHCMDRLLQSNTSKRLTYSLFLPGFMIYDLIPDVPAPHRLCQKLRHAVSNLSELEPQLAMAE